MRLRTIKLSGFKSFVDPTTLVVPDNLVGIVGPNGCGKSNIIDAVTWVMGESSAKYLRGESLTDVIFNGSGARQPVGQATVELVFDNSRHTLGGRYASYSELSVKRQINREGISTYFLNGARCRRKDIQGLFLGTGLGPRSYAIIEQGVISRLIDARPEELRMFVEEAAGISRFRERRRETENRIRHTRENLERLNDIREELGRQLVHLQRQARAAERYQVLRQAERQTKAQLLAINWRDLNAQQDRRLSDVSDHETRVQSAIAALRSVEAEIERLRDGHSTASDEFNRLQSEFYAVGSDISQQEQKIQHAEERIKSLQTDIADAESSRAEASAQQQRDRAELEQLTTKAQSLEPQLAGSRNQSDAAYSALDQAENAMQTWQAEWDAFNEASAEFTRQLEVDRTRQEHIEADIEELLQRRQTLTRELEKIESTTQSQDSETLAGEITELEQQLTGFRRQLDDARSSSRAGKQELDVTEHT
ncbi:MAG: chromosome segregation SMC family protein, partial [Candidatus Zixiibacteriota bacterium]